MRLLFTVVAYFLWVGSVSSNPGFLVGSIGGVVASPAAGCGSVGLLDENFDGSGFCVFSPTTAGGNTIDPDDTSDPQSSPYGCKIVYSADDSVFASAQITPQTGIIYYKIKIKVLGDFSTTFQYLHVLSSSTGSSISGPGNVFSIRVGQTGAGNARIGLFNSSNAGTYYSGSLNTWYTVLVKTYSDGTTNTEWKVNGTAQTSISETNDRDAGYVYLGSNATLLAVLNSNGILVDDVVVSASASDVGW